MHWILFYHRKAIVYRYQRTFAEMLNHILTSRGLLQETDRTTKERLFGRFRLVEWAISKLNGIANDYQHFVLVQILCNGSSHKVLNFFLEDVRKKAN